MPKLEHPGGAVDSVRPAEEGRTAVAHALLEVLQAVLRLEEFTANGIICASIGAGKLVDGAGIRGQKREYFRGIVAQAVGQAGRFCVHGWAVSRITSAESRKASQRPSRRSASARVTLCCPRNQT